MSASPLMDGSDGGVDPPLLREVFPRVTARVAEILVGLGGPELAAGLRDQGFYGRCDCRPDCRFVLTAPVGSAGSRMLWLEIDGQTVDEVSLDPDGAFVTNFDIGDCPRLCPLRTSPGCS